MARDRSLQHYGAPTGPKANVADAVPGQGQSAGGQCTPLRSPFAQKAANAQQSVAPVQAAAAPVAGRRDCVDEWAHTHHVLRDCSRLNAPVCFIRPSAAVLPGSLSTRRKTMLPFGFVVQPLAASGEEQVQTLDVGSSGAIERCTSCQAYLNPYVQRIVGFLGCAISANTNKPFLQRVFNIWTSSFALCHPRVRSNISAGVTAQASLHRLWLLCLSSKFPTPL